MLGNLIKDDPEFKRYMEKVGMVVQQNHDTQMERYRRDGRKGSMVKLYACRQGRSSNSAFTTTDASRRQVKYITQVLNTVMNIDPSISVLVRRAISCYHDELIAVLLGYEQKDIDAYIVSIGTERDYLYEVANMKEKGKK